jgi:hypothetical protein
MFRSSGKEGQRADPTPDIMKDQNKKGTADKSGVPFKITKKELISSSWLLL